MSTEPIAVDLDELLARVPEGWTRFEIDGQPWAVSRVARARGRSVTLEAEQLGTTDRFGANIWLTSSGAVLKPCEVPAEKVLELLRALPHRSLCPASRAGGDVTGDDGEVGGPARPFLVDSRRLEPA